MTLSAKQTTVRAGRHPRIVSGALKGKSPGAGEPHATPPALLRPAPLERKPTLVKDICVQYESGGVKRIAIEFDHYHKPLLASILKGDEPEVRITLQNGRLNPGIPKTIDVSGQYLRRIRTVLDKTNETLNIILDLKPRADCRVNYVHYLGKNLFCVDITCDIQEDLQSDESRAHG